MHEGIATKGLPVIADKRPGEGLPLYTSIDGQGNSLTAQCVGSGQRAPDTDHWSSQSTALAQLSTNALYVSVCHEVEAAPMMDKVFKANQALAGVHTLSLAGVIWPVFACERDLTSCRQPLALRANI